MSDNKNIEILGCNGAWLKRLVGIKQRGNSKATIRLLSDPLNAHPELLHWFYCGLLINFGSLSEFNFAFASFL